MGMNAFLDIPYNEFCALEAYLPPTNGFPILVYFHGGGFVEGDKKDTSEIAKSFVRAGYGVVTANYRMYHGGARFPDFLRDGADVVAWVKQHVAELGGNGEVYVCGQSAGAWLTVMLCVTGKYLRDVGIDPAEIKGWISDSAQMTSHYNMLAKERGENPMLQRIDELAPLYYVDEDTAFSKMLLVYYSADIPCRKEQNLLFYKSVLHFNPHADITEKELSGRHCAGSCEKDETGEFPFVKTALAWLKGEK